MHNTNLFSNMGYQFFIGFLIVLVFLFWEYPEGMNQILVFINLKIRHAQVEVMRIYFKWKLLRELNKFNKELGLPPIPWNHKKN
ncbi:hypothetical protein SCREM1_84 [Synechococcus phage S-CREM1]|nr:hypothetical protein SCREM1_84 [Synechococcus phage S-CREM1]